MRKQLGGRKHYVCQEKRDRVCVCVRERERGGETERWDVTEAMEKGKDEKIKDKGQTRRVKDMGTILLL